MMLVKGGTISFPFHSLFPAQKQHLKTQLCFATIAAEGENMKEAFEVRNRRLLETARDMILRGGLQGASMADISKAARVPVGTIYNMYPTKEALINAVYIYCRSNSIGSIRYPDITAPEQAESAVKACIIQYLDTAIANSNDYMFVARYYLDPVIDPGVHSSGNDAFGSVTLEQLYGAKDGSPAFLLLSHMVLAMLNKAIDLHLANRVILDDAAKQRVAEICWHTMTEHAGF